MVDRGPAALTSILMWFLTVTMIFSVAARLGFRFTSVKLRYRDDIAITLAAVCIDGSKVEPATSH